MTPKVTQADREAMVVRIVAVNLGERQCLSERGDMIPLTNFFDSEGDECEPEEAVMAVAGRNNTWFAVDLRDFGGSRQ